MVVEFLYIQMNSWNVNLQGQKEILTVESQVTLIDFARLENLPQYDSISSINNLPNSIPLPADNFKR